MAPPFFEGKKIFPRVEMLSSTDEKVSKFTFEHSPRDKSSITDR